MNLVLTPYAGDPDVADPALTGEWAVGMSALTDGAQVPPWCSHIARRDGEPVAIGAFKGGPDEAGAVEIAYITFVPARGTGVATQVVAALIDMARGEGAPLVRAHTLTELNSSTSVLTANGFKMTGAVVDPEDGPVWRWERVLDGLPEG